jgi:hypothetical protein
LATRAGARWLLAIVLLIGGPAPDAVAGEYRTIEVESLRIEIDSEWGMRTTPGYVPVRFDITNLGEARVIDLVGQGSRFVRTSRGGGGANSVIRQSIRLARGDRVRLTIPVPVFGTSESIRFDIQENGRTLDRFNFIGFQSNAAAGDASALIVADRGSPFGAAAAGWAREIGAPGAYASGYVISSPGSTTVTATATGRGMHPGGPGRPPLDFVLAPSRLPTNWIGYTSLRAVVIGPTEWEQLNEAQKSALLTWTACGGDLLFVDGDLKALLPTAPNPPVPDDRAPRAYFFGRIHRPTSASVSAAGLKQILSDAQKVQDSNWSLPVNGVRDWSAIAARGFRLPIPGIEGVPARAYMMILLFFSFIIGPVNYWVLRRHRQQVLLVLTAPLISATFILLLGGYALAGEGIGVRGRAVSFTMLDEVRKQAATRTSSSLYAAGMTPSGGLRFPRDTAAIPIGVDGTGTRERFVLDVTEAQQFSSGIIQARSPTNLEQLAFRSARERLSFNTEGGAMTVVNGLGTTVTSMVYRDRERRYSLNAPLAPGAKATLTSTTSAAGIVVPLDLPLSARFVHLVQHQPAGSYLAVLERSPFWDPGVSNVLERGSFHLVIGWPGGQP